MNTYSNKNTGKAQSHLPAALNGNKGNYLADNRQPLQAKSVKKEGVVQLMLSRTTNSVFRRVGPAVARRFHHQPPQPIGGGGQQHAQNVIAPIAIPPQQLPQVVNPPIDAVVPYQPPQDALVPHRAPVHAEGMEVNAVVPRRRRKRFNIRKYVFKPGGFTLEMYAGLRGYITHYFFGPDVVIFTPTDQARIYFDLELRRLLARGIVPRWCHQLIFQNASQAMSGNKLPMEAAVFMIKALEEFGLAAMANANRMKLLTLYTRFQLGSVPYFLRGGSSYAPALMHTLGMLLQTFPIALLGRRWVLRTASKPALRGNNLAKGPKKGGDTGETQ